MEGRDELVASCLHGHRLLLPVIDFKQVAREHSGLTSGPDSEPVSPDLAPPSLLKTGHQSKVHPPLTIHPHYGFF